MEQAMQTMHESEREAAYAAARVRCLEALTNIKAEMKLVRRGRGRALRVAACGYYGSPTQIPVTCVHWPGRGPALMAPLDRVAITIMDDKGVPLTIRALHWETVKALASDYLTAIEEWPGWFITPGPLPAELKEKLVALEFRETPGTSATK